jgi:type II secretory pathway component GspD/PulD (secretin)
MHLAIARLPNITVTNGREAYITTGDEFSYIASIKSATDAQGQITTTSDIQRMSVGIDMRVTPKILPLTLLQNTLF